MKKVLAMLLTICMVMASGPQAAFAADVAGGNETEMLLETETESLTATETELSAEAESEEIEAAAETEAAGETEAVAETEVTAETETAAETETKAQKPAVKMTVNSRTADETLTETEEMPVLLGGGSEEGETDCLVRFCDSDGGGMLNIVSVPAGQTLMTNEHGNVYYTDEYGEIQTVSDMPRRNGSYISGWSLIPNGTENALADAVTVTESMELYAIWSEGYTVTIDLNGGYDADDDTRTVISLVNRPGYQLGLHDWGIEEIYEQDGISRYEVLARFTPLKDGSVFVGYSRDPDATAHEFDSSEISVNGDMTLYAVWGETVNITFSSGGDPDVHDYVLPLARGSRLYTESDHIGLAYRNYQTGNEWYTSLDWFNHDGKAVSGWSLTPGGAVDYDAFDDIPTDQDLTLYAVYEQMYVVTLDYQNQNLENGTLSLMPGDEICFYETYLYVEGIGYDYAVLEGHRLIGWSLTPGGPVAFAASEASLIPEGDMTLYAVWQEAWRLRVDDNDIMLPKGTYIRFKSQGVVYYQTVDTSEEFFVYPSRDGYEVAGWTSTSGSSRIDYALDETILMTSDVTIYPVWKAARKLTLIPGHDEETVTFSYPVGDYVVFHRDNMESYHNSDERGAYMDLSFGEGLLGWSRTQGASVPDYTWEDMEKFTKNTTLYGVWGSMCVLRLYPYGASGEYRQYELMQGTRAEISEYRLEISDGEYTSYEFDDISAAGKTLTGWTEAKTGEGYLVTDFTVTENMNLYGVWEDAWEVSLDSNGVQDTRYHLNVVKGGIVRNYGSEITAVWGEKITDSVYMEFENPGYYIASWNTKANGRGQTVDLSSEYMPTGNVTLYAQWKPAKTLTLKANNGTTKTVSVSICPGERVYLSSDFVNAYGYGGSSRSFNFTLKGFCLTGWNTAANGSGTQYDCRVSFKPEDDLTLYACWTPAYSVTFKGAGFGGDDRVITAAEGSSLNISMDQVICLSGQSYHAEGLYNRKSGYSLAGWNTKADGSGRFFAIGYSGTFKENLVLYPVWKACAKVRFVTGVSPDLTIDVQEGARIRVRENAMHIYEPMNATSEYIDIAAQLTRPGSYMVGWSRDADATVPEVYYEDVIMPDGNVTYYAVWAKAVNLTLMAETAEGKRITTLTVPENATLYSKGNRIKISYNGHLVADEYLGDFLGSGATMLAGWAATKTGAVIYPANSEFRLNGETTLYARLADGYAVRLHMPEAEEVFYVTDEMTLFVNNRFAYLVDREGKIRNMTRHYLGHGKVITAMSTLAGGKGTLYDMGAPIRITKNLDLYPVLETGRKITVHFNGPETTGAYEGTDTAMSVYVDKDATLQVTENKLMAFAPGSGTDTLDFNPGGTAGGIMGAPFYYLEDTEERVLVGWSYTADGAQLHSFSERFTVTADTVIYLIWDQPVTVTLKSNDSRDITEKAYLPKGAGLSVLESSLIRNDGHRSYPDEWTIDPDGASLTVRFKGWNTKANGTGTNYAPGASFKAAKDMTLYAIWEETGSLPDAGRIIEKDYASLNIYLRAGETFKLEGLEKIWPEGIYRWLAADPYVATVDQTGKVTAKHPGKTMIRQQVGYQYNEYFVFIYVTAGSEKIVNITGQPAAQNMYAGQTAVFSVKAQGDIASWQWQYKTATGSGWMNATAAGNKTAQLSVPATAGRDGYMYRCKITDTAGGIWFSGAAVLSLKAVPDINSQPSDVSAAAGKTVTFKVGTTETPASYQWKYKTPVGTKWLNATAEGNTTQTLKVPVTKGKDGYIYKCVVTFADSTVKISQVAKLTVKAANAIIDQTGNVTANVGDTGIFKVTAAGQAKSFQWQYKAAAGSSWANATAAGSKTATLGVPATSSRNGYSYKCIVTFADGSTLTSEPAKLTVKVPAAITTHPKSQTLAAGKTAVFTVAASGNVTAYQWQYKTPYGSKWLNATASGAQTASVSVPATIARDTYAYRCKVTFGDGSTRFSRTAILRVNGIKVQPKAVTVSAGATATFKVTASGEAAGYQWEYKAVGGSSWGNATAAGNKTAELKVPATTGRNGYSYRCRITFTDGSTKTSTAAVLTVN